MDVCKVSVIIPVYNAGRFLAETLDSIISQTLKEIEIICVDDGSTDDSIAIIENYMKIDYRITLMRQTESSCGAALARNLGIAHAKGEYLSILDADDLFDADMLEKSYEKASKTKADVVMYGAVFYDTETKENVFSEGLSRFQLFPDEEFFHPTAYADNLFQRFLGGAWAGLFNRYFIQKHKITFYSVHVTDDIEFTYTALASAERIATIKRCFVHYRRNAEGNQTSNLDKHPETGWKAFLHFKEALEQRGLYDRFKKSYVNLMMGMTCNIYLKSMTNLANFKLLFGKLKQIFPEMGAFDIEDGDFEDLIFVKKRDRIMSESPEDYLLQESLRDSTEFRKAPLIHVSDKWKTDDCISLILYGAGFWGKSVFHNLLGNPMFRLVHWVDQKYKKIGYPIENPEIVMHSSFDLIYIAIKDINVCKNVEENLLRLGVDKNKIAYSLVVQQ